MNQPDLRDFLIAHQGLRTEFDTTAWAAWELDPQDTPAVSALEDELALVLGILRTHHLVEDTEVWPALLHAAPQAAAPVARLEAQHEALEALVTAAADRTVALHRRIPALRELQVKLNEHLDLEEAEIVPLIVEHIPAAEWDRIEAVARTHTDPADAERVAAWLAKHAEHEFAEAAA